MYCSSLVSYYYYHNNYYYFPSFFCPVELSSFQPMNFISCPTISSLSHLCGRRLVSKYLGGVWLPAWLNHNPHPTWSTKDWCNRRSDQMCLKKFAVSTLKLFNSCWNSCYFLSEVLHLFSGLCYVTLYLLCMFPVVLFITSGAWIKGIILLYFVTLAYDRIKLLAMKLIWYLYSALPSSQYFGSHLRTINY